MSNVKVMYSVYFKKGLSKAIPPFDILRFAVPTMYSFTRGFGFPLLRFSPLKPDTRHLKPDF